MALLALAGWLADGTFLPSLKPNKKTRKRPSMTARASL
jgi:hypothetical protein